MKIIFLATNKNNKDSSLYYYIFLYLITSEKNNF